MTSAQILEFSFFGFTAYASGEVAIYTLAFVMLVAVLLKGRWPMPPF